MMIEKVPGQENSNGRRMGLEKECKVSGKVKVLSPITGVTRLPKVQAVSGEILVW